LTSSRKRAWVGAWLGAIALWCGVSTVQAQGDAPVASEIAYYGDNAPDAYAAERCRIDLYTPAEEGAFATVVWFHAGGLTSGSRWAPRELLDAGIAVAAVDYRLGPRASAPAYLEDAAAATAWVLERIEDFGGDRERVVVAGHSAGGYLASMVGLDDRWLLARGVDRDLLAGIASISGHSVTHFRVRAERGIEGTRAIVDDLAPLYHVRSDAPPIVLITGDREREMLGRYEETAYFARMMRVVGHPDTTLFELDGFDHGGVVGPGLDLVVDFVERVTRGRGQR
jgi:acetyl esterase/lipase